MPHNVQEYNRLRRQIYKTPILAEPVLMAEIEAFGKDPENKKYYQKLKRKFWWHRKVRKGNFPLGTAPVEWTQRHSPLVSVIVPNYNHAPYLQERIECILNQTFQNFELIILDDCSTDNSRDVLLRYKNHPRVSHLVFNEQNTGNTFLQWEKGVTLAKGIYIWIAESDDYADETFLESMMAVLCLHPDSVLVRSGSYQVNQNGRVLVRDWDFWKEDETVHYYDGEKYIRHNLLHFNFIYNASMVVFRKDVFQQIDRSYQQCRYVGDWQFWIEMLLCGPICEYRRKLNYFRQHENKVTVRSVKSQRGIIDQIKVLAYAINHVKMSMLCKQMIRGEAYEAYLLMSKEGNDPVALEACLQALGQDLNVTHRDYKLYKFFRRFRCLPFIPTLENDKYK